MEVEKEADNYDTPPTVGVCRKRREITGRFFDSACGSNRFLTRPGSAVNLLRLLILASDFPFLFIKYILI
ncbi:hypothetical protein Pfo_027450 [Paulownia fortunei]|nr:hypothetical protein Pfo_027450 [Paulownia fortunei]